MEVLAIQKSALDGMKNELKALLELTENATQKYTPIFKEEQWLDNQEVCLMMNITKRTLQTYKSKGLLPYSNATISSPLLCLRGHHRQNTHTVPPPRRRSTIYLRLYLEKSLLDQCLPSPSPDNA